MNGQRTTPNETSDLATQIADRYGRLALTRAAGEAAAAEKRGDPAKHVLWSNVVAHLRQSAQTTCLQMAT